MELVFIRIKESKFSDQAEPFAEKFAKDNGLKLTKYVDINEIPKEFDELKAYPVLFFVEDGKILGYVKGFSNEEKQMKTYENELDVLKNPGSRPVE